MKSAWLVAAGLALAPLATSAWCQQMDFDKVQIITEKLGPNVYREPRTIPAFSDSC